MSDSRSIDPMTELAELREAVSELQTRQAIQDVYARYGRAIDRLDEELYRSAFWPEAEIKYGTLEPLTPNEHWGELQGHEQVLVAWGHLLTNQAIEIENAMAHVETYVTTLSVPRDRRDDALFLAGRYVDRVDRRDAEWRIAVRQYVPHFAMRADTSNYDDMIEMFFPGPPPPPLANPWSNADISYIRPLEPTTEPKGTPG
jgi:hypothetical protein